MGATANRRAALPLTREKRDERREQAAEEVRKKEVSERNVMCQVECLCLHTPEKQRKNLDATHVHRPIVEWYCGAFLPFFLHWLEVKPHIEPHIDYIWNRVYCKGYF